MRCRRTLRAITALATVQVVTGIYVYNTLPFGQWFGPTLAAVGLTTGVFGYKLVQQGIELKSAT
ncbi:hypothetical protein CEB3_c50280 [Peptococcaceae bacterium CEB3]|nr:hypothetical protein CEB3_c50280 [Peptococcaceae bacterium CEB3]